MKSTLISLVYALFMLTDVKGQTFALASHSSNSGFVSYSNSDFINYRERKPHNKKMFAGGMVAASGGVCFVSSFYVLMFLTYGPDRDKGEVNYANQNIGLGLMAGGVALAVTGMAIAIKGHHEKKFGWSLSPISTKPNEIGIAYNF